MIEELNTTESAKLFLYGGKALHLKPKPTRRRDRARLARLHAFAYLPFREFADAAALSLDLAEMAKSDEWQVGVAEVLSRFEVSREIALAALAMTGAEPKRLDPETWSTGGSAPLISTTTPS